MRVAIFIALCACSSHEAKQQVKQPPPPLTAPGLRLPEGVTPLAYDLRLEIDPNDEQFRGTVTIHARIDKPLDRVWIHQDQLTILDAAFDGGKLVDAGGGDQMRAYRFGRTLERGELKLTFAYTGRMDHDEEGLFRQQAGDSWYVFSQAESVFARRITPCFDEPKWKTPWRVTLVVPRGAVALANMPQLRETPAGDRREIEFAETPPMPSYLLAVTVGPFDVVDAGTVGRAKLPLRAVVQRGDRDRAGIVKAKTPAIVKALEDYTNDALPWPKLDFVAVPHLFGAMENPGLVTFDAGMLVGDEARRGFRSRFMHIAAHELAHMWFGNLVTPAWWDDLWLSEAFASWLSDKVAAQLGAFEDPLLRAAIARERALTADDEPSARPLRAATRNNDDPDSSFDDIAYEKGAAVLATFEQFVGETPMQAAVRAYLGKHRNATATTPDFLAAFGATTSNKLAHALAGYLDRAGAPIVELAVDCSAKPRAIAKSRDARSVPVCIRFTIGDKVERRCDLATGATEFELPACPTWIYGNDGAGYYHLVSPAQTTVDKLRPEERIAWAADAVAALERGELAIAEAARMVASLAALPDPTATHSAAAIALAIDPLVGDSARPVWTAWLARTFAKRATKLFASNDPIDRRLRDDLVELLADAMPAAVVDVARKRVDEMLAKGRALDPDLVAICATSGGRPLFDKILALATTTRDDDVREAAFESLGRFGPEFVGAVVDLLKRRDDIEPWRAFEGLLARAATRATAWHQLRDNTPLAFAKLTPVQVANVVETLDSQCDATSRAEVAAAFEPRVRDIFNGRRVLDRTLAAIDTCIARRAKAGDITAQLP